jgi:hemerythrin
MPLEWDPEYAVGHAGLDAQHSEIIQGLGRLGDAIGSEQAERISVALGELDQLLRTHFADEERWMTAQGYPRRAAHLEGHAACLESLVTAVRLHAEGGASERFVDVIERVARWLDVHLRSEDLRLGRHGQE